MSEKLDSVLNQGEMYYPTDEFKKQAAITQAETVLASIPLQAPMLTCLRRPAPGIALIRRTPFVQAL